MRGCSAFMKITLQGFSKNLGGGVCFSCAQPEGHYKHIKKIFSAIFAGLAVSSAFYTAMPQLNAAPRELIDITSVNSNIHVDMAYLGRQNFLGRRVANYRSNTCYLLPATANALSRANERLERLSYRITVRDCWRPSSASIDMSNWADTQDQKNLTDRDLNAAQKVIFEDPRLFDQMGILRPSRLKRLGYLALYSNHNKGSTVDLELLEWVMGRWEKADTGTAFDVFSRRSGQSAQLNSDQKHHRNLISGVMSSEGFRGLATEWWHWTHRNSNGGSYLDGTVD